MNRKEDTARLDGMAYAYKQIKADCLADNLVSWDDYTQMIKDELDLQIEIRLNE